MIFHSQAGYPVDPPLARSLGNSILKNCISCLKPTAEFPCNPLSTFVFKLDEVTQTDLIEVYGDGGDFFHAIFCEDNHFVAQKAQSAQRTNNST